MFEEYEVTYDGEVWTIKREWKLAEDGSILVKLVRRGRSFWISKDEVVDPTPPIPPLPVGTVARSSVITQGIWAKTSADFRYFSPATGSMTVSLATDPDFLTEDMTLFLPDGRTMKGTEWR